MKSQQNLIRLSQGQLNLLEICPPKFQQIYLNKLSSLPNPETEAKQTWGSRFHLLMQQRELGLPIDSLLKKDEELARSLEALLEAAPDILDRNSYRWREAEHSRTLNFGNYLLTVIYDLLIADEHQAQIIDWKTYLKPQNKNKLAHNWQTRLYLYTLVETSEYRPAQISMTYWFVKLPNKPESQVFTYSNQQHQQTEQNLHDLLTNLDIWLEETGDFPHHPNCEYKCPYAQELLNQENDCFLCLDLAKIQYPNNVHI
ncbi:MAG: PD-(D/E)XK nuclease family protein [Xenococcus sp. (in: cyanobacteria)]